MPVGEFRLASLYCPCETLCGDFYDLAWRGDCAMLLVADVMGHGVEAALISMLAKAAFVEAAGETSDPRALLAGMRARLNRLMPDRAYVAAVVARLPFEGAAIGLANAGLPHPFVLRSGGRRVQDVPLDGVPMGLFLDQDPEPATAAVVRLDPGDVLLLASDGSGAFEGRDGHLFQNARLFRTLERVARCSGRDAVDGLTVPATGAGQVRGVPDDLHLISVCRIDVRPPQGAWNP
jgi:serine phosphatase RsbU (regulator of sigma subunit)